MAVLLSGNIALNNLSKSMQDQKDKVQRISVFVELSLSNTLSILLLADKLFFEDWHVALLSLTVTLSEKDI